MEQIAITKNLELISIEANLLRYDEQGRKVTRYWALNFRFHGIEGFVAFLSDTEINHPYPSYSFIESYDDDLVEYFEETIDNCWSRIVAVVKKWELENLEKQTADCAE